MCDTSPRVVLGATYLDERGGGVDLGLSTLGGDAEGEDSSSEDGRLHCERVLGVGLESCGGEEE